MLRSILTGVASSPPALTEPCEFGTWLAARCSHGPHGPHSAGTEIEFSPSPINPLKFSTPFLAEDFLPRSLPIRLSPRRNLTVMGATSSRPRYRLQIPSNQ